MAVAVQQFRNFTADDLLKPGMPEKFVEIIEGELVTMTPAGWQHNRIALRLMLLFSKFTAGKPGIQVGTDNDGFLIQRDPDTLLSPDTSLYRGQLDPEEPWIPFAPELVVEIKSPSNTASEIVYKRNAFLRAGSRQFWLIDATEKTLAVYYADGRRVTFSGDEPVRGEGIAEGLEFPLASLWMD